MPRERWYPSRPATTTAAAHSAMFALFPLLAGAVVSMVPAVPTMLCQRHRIARSRLQPIFCAEGRPSLDNLKTLDTLINRGLDTVEDAWLLARRVTADYVDPIDCLESWEDPEDTRPRLLVIGSGWAAHALVKIVDADLYRLLVVSPRNYFLFTPMLAASSVGTVQYLPCLTSQGEGVARSRSA